MKGAESNEIMAKPGRQWDGGAGAFERGGFRVRLLL